MARSITVPLVLCWAALAVAGCKKTPSSSDAPGAGTDKVAPSTASGGDPAPAASKTGPAASATADQGWYRVVLTDPRGEEVPFFLRLPPGQGHAQIDAGSEPVDAHYRWDGAQVAVDFGLYHTHISAKRAADGTLSGRWDSHSRSFGDASLTLHASPVPRADASLRFQGAGSKVGATSIAGTWKVNLSQSGPAKLVLKSDKDGCLRASLLFSSGNIVSLLGGVVGSQLELSGFDGSSPYQIRAGLSKDAMNGNWLAGPKLDWHETFTGARTKDFPFRAEVQPTTAHAHLKLPVLKSARYRGKPIVVELSGSWCPACGPATRTLAQLYGQYHPAGLEVVTLDYEFTKDKAFNRKQAEALKRTYDIPWEVIAVNGDVASAADILPKALDNVNPGGFPIAVFVARDGTIAGVHAGFPAFEGVGGFEQAVEDYRTLIKRIVGKKK